MAKILVTGGAGFIGAHTARQLLDAGEEVVALDYFHQYIHPVQPSYLENTQWRFDELLKGADIRYGTTTHKDDLRRNLNEVQPTHILHLAALPLANVALKQTEEAFDSIVRGTVNLLEVLRDGPPIEKFVYVSSSMAYGDFTQIPMPEDAPKHPKEIYGGMKYAGETLVRVYAQRYGIPFSIVRPSAVYGPSDNNGRVLQVFVENAVAGRPIKVTNPDSTSLDFTWINDVAGGMAKVVLSPAAVGEDFNITRGEGQTLREAIDILRGLFPDLVVEERSETGGYRPDRGSLDISKARRMLGFDPTVSLAEGLPVYVDWVRQHNRSLVKQGVQ